LEEEEAVLSAFVNAFRTPDLRPQAAVRPADHHDLQAGSQVPAPGVNVANVESCLAQVEDQGLYA
jgi:preprotein translocase subunit SecY